MSDPMSERTYTLNLDGPSLRKQRELLDRLANEFSGSLWRKDRETIDGLINLLDALADQAHDRYGEDCLLGSGSV